MTSRDDPNFVLDYLKQVEELAEDVLTDKQQIVDLDKMRNTNREAIRALRTAMKSDSDHKIWMNIGGQFIKYKACDGIKMLESDQTELDNQINSLRNGLLAKVNKLNDAQGKADLKGFNLAPLSRQEMSAMKY